MDSANKFVLLSWNLRIIIALVIFDVRLEVAHREQQKSIDDKRDLERNLKREVDTAMVTLLSSRLDYISMTYEWCEVLYSWLDMDESFC